MRKKEHAVKANGGSDTNKHEVRDRRQIAVTVTKRRGLKAIIPWLLFIGLCGGVGWQALRMMGGWFSSSPTPAVYGPGIELKSDWLREFDPADPVSFLTRGAQCLVSSAQSVSAVNMLTGDLLWQTEEVPGLILHTSSDDPALPLLGLQLGEKGRATLTRLDPASGAVLWQQNLDASAPRIHFDDRHIIVLDDSRISLYTLAGERVWQQTFQDRFIPQTVVFRREILLGRYAGEKVRLSYLSRERGELLWERHADPLLPAYAVPNIDRQLLYTEDGRTMLLDLNTQETLWDAPKDLGYVLGHTSDPDSGQLSLHTTIGMAQEQDGELRYSYPPGFRLVGATDAYLILLQGGGGRQNTCLLLDKRSGEAVQQYHDLKWFAVFYLSEDRRAIYLAVNSTPGGSRDTSVHTHLIRLDKQSLELQDILVGRNIGTIRFKVFSQEARMFIPLYQRIGGYLLPEM